VLEAVELKMHEHKSKVLFIAVYSDIMKTIIFGCIDFA
jgi:hypothetical protein